MGDKDIRNFCDYALLATDPHGGIGSDGDLLVTNKEDMKFFKEKTKNSFLIMGSKTYSSLPIPSLLLRDSNIGIVLTRKPREKQKELEKGFIAMTEDEFLDGTVFLMILSHHYGLDLAITYFNEKKIVMIGGSRLYNQLDRFGVNTVYRTTLLGHIKKVPDTFVNLNQNIFKTKPKRLFEDNEIIISKYSLR